MTLIAIIHSLSCPHDIDDIQGFKVVGSNVNLTDNIFQKFTFPAETN